MELDLLQAAELLKKGEVVAVPTETVYGLAASLFQEKAIHKIFALKQRPLNNPLIIHVANQQEILAFTGLLGKDFTDLSAAFWPGPLTLVLPIIPKTVPEIARAKLLTAAFRIPGHPLARELLKLTGPLVMPSANLSGRPSSTSRAHVEKDFGKDFPVLDGGECVSGLESTILYQDGCYKIIRQGAIPQEEFFKVLSYTPKITDAKKDEKPLCPGQLYRHYAPKARLILQKEIPDTFEGAIIGFEERTYPKNCILYLLGSLKDPASISKNLYKVLRQLDDDGILEAIVDIDMPDHGIFSTIQERLKKASVPY
ncbi:MAG TPA: L-threonylcarbamoyladenylate synthase [Parachlamydiaceae bacterium]|nr:L-threonylcarbamoyladenylate synthase [Parachlamydiaceae bacterium]